MRGSFAARFATGLVSLHLFVGCVGELNAQRPSSVAMPSGMSAAQFDSSTEETGSVHRLVSPDVYREGSQDDVQQDEVFDNFERAFQSPEKVKRLSLQNEDHEMRHLPSRLGTLVNLEALEISCLENLEDLPEEIGRLRKLEELIIDNGNGCRMNVSLPRSIGRLGNLRVLRLYGALDPREIDSERATRRAQSKRLPDTLADLQKLEELDLGRNGIRAVPPQVASLRRLKRLGLDYNDIRLIPSFVGDLKNLEELSLRSNGGVRLPQSLARVKGLKVFMGNNSLTLREQRQLRARFPNIVFSFENEFDDSAANEEPAKPKSKARRGRKP